MSSFPPEAEPGTEIRISSACALCKAKNARYRCAACQTAHYCSKEHQREHWKSKEGGHKRECRKRDPRPLENPASRRNRATLLELVRSRWNEVRGVVLAHRDGGRSQPARGCVLFALPDATDRPSPSPLPSEVEGPAWVTSADEVVAFGREKDRVAANYERAAAEEIRPMFDRKLASYRPQDQILAGLVDRCTGALSLFSLEVRMRDDDDDDQSSLAGR